MDAFHGRVLIGPNEHAAPLDYGIHRAVGGDHDLPNPGDLRCAALAACLDSTLRTITEHLGVNLTRLEVAVEAEVDVRGTLLVDRAVPVGFQRMQCHVDLAVDEATAEPLVRKLLQAAEHSCVNLQTLRASVPVSSRWIAGEPAPSCS